MDNFTLSAPLAPPDDVLLTSFYENLVAALGKVTGGMLPDDHKLDVADDSLSLMCLQAMCMEAGLEVLVMGISPSLDDTRVYAAMSDGTIWSFEATIRSGSLVTEAKKALAEDVTENCVACADYAAAVKFVATNAIAETGEVEAVDSINGSISTDVHAAICHRMKGTGRLIVRGEGGFIKNAYEFVLDCPPRIDADEATAMVGLRKLELEEIKEEEENYKRQLGVNSPFVVKVGQA